MTLLPYYYTIINILFHLKRQTVFTAWYLLSKMKVTAEDLENMMADIIYNQTLRNQFFASMVFHELYKSKGYPFSFFLIYVVSVPQRRYWREA